jgi:hypothetical protein
MAAAPIHQLLAKRFASSRTIASTITAVTVLLKTPCHCERTIVPQSSFEMPWRRSHQPVAMPNGSETAQRTVTTTTPVINPAFTRPSPSERASRGPRLTMTTSASTLAIVPRSQP